MSQEKIQLTEYALKNVISSLSYADSRHKVMLLSVLQILQHENRGLEERKVDQTFKYLEEARLLSPSVRKTLRQKLFSENN